MNEYLIKEYLLSICFLYFSCLAK